MKAFEVDNISKRFGETVALDNVTFSGDTGEIHGLIGENGAGKSTLMKVLGGVISPDSGAVNILGKEVTLKNPWEGVQNQVVVVHQELSLVADLTVAENMYLPTQPHGRLGVVAKKQVERSAAQHLAELGITDIKPGRIVGRLSLRDKQIIEIAKALIRKAQILVLDEPTSSLGIKDVEWLFALVDRLSRQGVAIVYISHRMGEIRGLCKRLTVLRNGKNVGTCVTEEVSDEEVVKMMLGRSIEVAFPEKTPPKAPAVPVVEARSLHVGSALKGLDFTLNRGEVLGIAALQGQGQAALFASLFGIVPVAKGELFINGEPVHFRSPREAIRQGLNYNVGFIPEDRKTDGLIVEMPVRENATLVTIDSFSQLGWVRRRREAAEIARVFDEMNIDLQKTNDVANALSGGNQQKLVIAKWLLTNCSIMLMDDPTRGVDVGTKVEIYKLVRRMAEEGKSVLLYSSELTEVLGLSDRVIVLYQGRVTAEFSDRHIDDQRVLTAMLGISGNGPAHTDTLEGRSS